MLWFILVTVTSVGLIAAFIILELRLIKKYGFPELPDDIQEIDNRIENEPLVFDLSRFVFGGEWLGRKLYKRSYESTDGIWNLTVETEGETLSAYRAVLKHKKSRWLGCTREKCNKKIKPKLIIPGE